MTKPPDACYICFAHVDPRHRSAHYAWHRTLSNRPPRGSADDPRGFVDDEGRLQEIAENVLRVLKPEAFGRWMTTPIPALGGRTPFDAMLAGDMDAVVNVSRSYLDPSFS